MSMMWPPHSVKMTSTPSFLSALATRLPPEILALSVTVFGASVGVTLTVPVPAILLLPRQLLYRAVAEHRRECANRMRARFESVRECDSNQAKVTTIARLAPVQRRGRRIDITPCGRCGKPVPGSFDDSERGALIWLSPGPGRGVESGRRLVMKRSDGRSREGASADKKARQTAKLFGEAQLFVEIELPEVMGCRAVTELQVSSHLPWPIEHAQVGSALTGGAAADEAATINCAARATEHHPVFGREQHQFQVDLAAGHAVLKCVNRTEGGIERMARVRHEPTAEIALDQAAVGVASITTPGNVEVGAGIKGEVETTLKATEVESWRVAARRRVEGAHIVILEIELVAGCPRERGDILRETLLELEAFVRHAVTVADEATAKERGGELAGPLDLEKVGVQRLKLRMRGAGHHEEQGQRECRRHPHGSVIARKILHSASLR